MSGITIESAKTILAQALKSDPFGREEFTKDICDILISCNLPFTSDEEIAEQIVDFLES